MTDPRPSTHQRGSRAPFSARSGWLLLVGLTGASCNAFLGLESLTFDGPSGSGGAGGTSTSSDAVGGTITATTTSSEGSGASAGSVATSTTTAGGGVCEPGALETCYEGPAGTEAVGQCRAGKRTCDEQGAAWGACDDLRPAPENCETSEDDNCDGRGECKQEVVWAANVGEGSQTPKREHVAAMAVDSLGNVILVGGVRVSTQYGGFPLTVAGAAPTQYDVLVLKVAPDGGVLWAKNFGDEATQRGYAVAVDAADNIYVGGGFSGKLDLGGKVLENPVPEPPAGLKDHGFVAKLDPTGQLLDAYEIGGAGVSSGIFDIALGGDGAIFIAGAHAGAAEITPGNVLKFEGNVDGFVAKLTPQFDYVWAQRFGGAGYEIAESLAFGPSGDLYVTGLCGSKFAFPNAPTECVVQSADSTRIATARFDAKTGSVRWATALPEAVAEFGIGIAVGANDEPTVAGFFIGELTIAGETLTTSGAATDYGDGLLVHFDAKGVPVWAKHFFGAEDTQYVGGVAVDTGGDLWAVGAFGGESTVDGETLFSLGDSADASVTKLSPAGQVKAHFALAGTGHEQVVPDFGYAPIVGLVGHPIAAVRDSVGGVVVVGSTTGDLDFGAGPFTRSVWVARLSP